MKSSSELLKYTEKANDFGEKSKSFSIKLNSVSDAELRQSVSVLAKRSNKRLRDLESHGATSLNAYQAIQSKAVDGSPAFTTTKKGEIKFATSPSKMSREELVKEVQELRRFLTAQTSTVTGIKQRYRQSTQTLNERYGTNLSTYDIGQIFENFARMKSEVKYGSEQVLEIVKRLDIQNMSEEQWSSLFKELSNIESFSGALQKAQEWKEDKIGEGELIFND